MLTIGGRPKMGNPMAIRVTTRPQRKALLALDKRSPDGARNSPAFRRRFILSFVGYLGGQWLNMFVGIEPDGYTHT